MEEYFEEIAAVAGEIDDAIEDEEGAVCRLPYIVRQRQDPMQFYDHRRRNSFQVGGGGKTFDTRTVIFPDECHITISKVILSYNYLSAALLTRDLMRGAKGPPLLVFRQ